MALPYTPGQVALRRGEEDGELPETLDGMPIVLCTLHSQVAPVCAALAGMRVAYVQVSGGALPVSLVGRRPDAEGRGLLGTAIAVAPCLDGDVDCVTTAAAFALAARDGHDAIVCAVGPGIVGTGTRFGHGALSLADAANVGAALGGRPVLTVRSSEADAARTPPRRLASHAVGPRPVPGGDRRRLARRGRDRRLGRRVRGSAASSHGPRARRRSRVLPRRVRRGRRRTRDARLMEERRLGPVVGLGTWNTFDGDDAARARGRRRRARGRQPLLRLLADVRRRGARARRRARRPPRRGDGADEDLGAVAGGGATPARRSARLVRPRRHRAGAQPRRLGAAPALARGRMWWRAGSGSSASPTTHRRRSASSSGPCGRGASTRFRCRSTRASGRASGRSCRSQRSSASP